MRTITVVALAVAVAAALCAGSISRSQFQQAAVQTAITPAAAATAEPFEGLWAQTKEECLDEQGPNSRTLIDLSNVIDGKPVPLFDQYEYQAGLRIASILRVLRA